MNAVYIAASIPIFFLLIGIEAWVSRRQGIARYDFADSIADLSCGISQQVLSVFLKVGVVGGYVLVYDQLRLVSLPVDAWWTWALGLVGIDFAYYWSHRAAHRINFLWAAHVVHHQSEEYNLAVALRQSALQGLASVPFYLPLAIAGFPPLVFLSVKTIDTLYQFWIHTRTIDRMGPLEWVFNTPSHHRVHHGIDRRYIDKNYAGIFIVWDRLFGTFEPEDFEPAYGAVKPLRSWDWLRANVDQWLHIARMAQRTRRLRDKLLVWLAPPEWRPADLGGPVEIPDTRRDTQVKHHTPVPRLLRNYVVSSFVPIAIATVFIILSPDLGGLATAALVLWVLVTLSSWAALFEGKPWARALEVVRLVALVALTAWLAFPTPYFAPAVATASIFALVSTVVAMKAARLAPAQGSRSVA